MKVHVVKYRILWMCLSALLLLPGICAMIYSSVTSDNHAPLKVGIDYTGGTILQYGLNDKISNEDLTKTRTNLEKIGVENPYLQILNVNNTQQEKTSNNIASIISIRTKQYLHQLVIVDITSFIQNVENHLLYFLEIKYNSYQYYLNTHPLLNNSLFDLWILLNKTYLYFILNPN